MLSLFNSTATKNGPKFQNAFVKFLNLRFAKENKSGKDFIITWTLRLITLSGLLRNNNYCWNCKKRWEINGQKYRKRLPEGFLITRTDNSIKNHFYSILRRTIRWLNKEITKNKLPNNGSIKSLKT